MTRFSIVVCTYNPNLELLSRLLNAIQNLDFSLSDYEVIIIDNNSNPSLNSISCVTEFLNSHANSRILLEEKQGLTSARIAGIKAALHDWIIFFDDDNEPTNDYLIESAKVIDVNTNVGAWGPGIVNVVYTDNAVPKWLDKYRYIFQERNDKAIKYDNNLWWQFCYPFGTGLIIKKVICQTYITNVESKKYLLSDRKHKSLSSGGDMQLVYTALNMNFYAGVSPGIKLNHLICNSKSNTRYIGRLLFGSAASNLPAYFQCFPNIFQVPTYPGLGIILKKIYYILKVVYLKRGFREAYFELARYLGELEGILHLNPDIKKRKYLLLLELLLALR